MNETAPTHMDLYTFRINKELKAVAIKTLKRRMPAICRKALTEAINEEKSKQGKPFPSILVRLARRSFTPKAPKAASK